MFGSCHFGIRNWAGGGQMDKKIPYFNFFVRDDYDLKKIIEK